MNDFPPDVLRLFDSLNRRGVRYMVVGMSSAIMQGVPATTQDIDVWFERYSDDAVAEAVRDVGGVLIWRSDPPVIAGSEDLNIVDVVTHCGGLASFSTEYENVVWAKYDPTDTSIPLLPVDRVLASKKAANRPKDQLAILVIEDSFPVLPQPRRGKNRLK